jgi:hypothetical protein
VAPDQIWRQPDVLALISAEIADADREAQNATSQAFSTGAHSHGDGNLMESERALRLRKLRARASLLSQLLQLLQTAHSGALTAEIYPRPFAQLLAADEDDSLIDTRVRGGFGLIHLLIIGAPPLPADAESWTDIAQAAQMLGAECYRRQWAYQLQPLLDLLLRAAGAQNGRGRDANVTGLRACPLDAADDNGQ